MSARASAPDPMDHLIAALSVLNRLRFERIDAAGRLSPLDDLLLVPSAAGRDGLPRSVTYLGQREGRAWLFARDRPGIEALEPQQLSWAIAEGMVFAARSGVVTGAIDRAAVAAYARRYGLDPSSIGAHLAGRAAALRAIRRELAVLQAEGQSAHERSVLDRVSSRAERLVKEAGAEATVIARGRG